MEARLRFENMTTYVGLFTTYALPIAVTGSVIVCGLWIVPDGLLGMYGISMANGVPGMPAAFWNGPRS